MCGPIALSSSDHKRISWKPHRRDWMERNQTDQQKWTRLGVFVVGEIMAAAMGRRVR